MDVCLGPRNEFFFFLLRAQPVGFLFVPCTTIWKHGKLLYGGGEMKKRKHRFYFACFIRVPEERNNRISGWNLYLILLLQPFSFSFFFIFCIIFSLPHLKAIFNIRDGKKAKKKGGGEGGRGGSRWISRAASRNLHKHTQATLVSTCNRLTKE